jgi:antitoxin (DNA-binding transcriptional repressor) of toxin-antitoxin stability system
MIMVNIADAKAKLSELIEAVNNGEDVVICKHNRPVAELRAVPPARTAPRDLTPMFPDWKIDPAFFEPMTAEELALWEEGDPSAVGRVAEDSPPYEPTRKPRRKRR